MGTSMGRRAVEGTFSDSSSKSSSNKSSSDSLSNSSSNSSNESLDKSQITIKKIHPNCVQLNKDYLDCVEQINEDHCKQFYDDYLSCIDKYKQKVEN